MQGTVEIREGQGEAEMIKGGIFMGVLTMFIVTSQKCIAQETPNIIQEEESAEVFLEEYTDEFQEKFFEALKQKGIQNYDRAINLLLECKQLQPGNTALDHELAKVYFLEKRYIPAQQYAMEALISEPGNYWFLNNLVSITDKQGIPLNTLEGTIPYQNATLRSNLAKIYFLKGNYLEAKAVLRGLTKNRELSHLSDKINDSLNKTQKPEALVEVESGTASNDPSGNLEIENLRNTLKAMVNGQNYQGLEAKANEALEMFPLQPEFYYYRGLALNQMNRSSDALEVLKEGLGYLFEENQLANDFYKELAKAYNAVGNTSKANEYLSKIKPGF
ncbi:MAG: hypothetical protein AAGH81_09085 [Bacteroidota bacterium]